MRRGLFLLLMVLSSTLTHAGALDYSLPQINSALGFGLANANSLQRIAALEQVQLDYAVRIPGRCGFDDVAVGYFVDDTSMTFDLSTVVGTNAALVLLRMDRTVPQLYPAAPDTYWLHGEQFYYGMSHAAAGEYEESSAVLAGMTSDAGTIDFTVSGEPAASASYPGTTNIYVTLEFWMVVQ